MKNVTILARSLEATLYWLKLLNVIQIKNIPNSFIIGGKIQRRYPCPFCWMKWGTSMITALKLPAGPGWLLNEGPTLASCELGVLQIPSRLAHWSDMMENIRFPPFFPKIISCWLLAIESEVPTHQQIIYFLKNHILIGFQNW